MVLDFGCDLYVGINLQRVTEPFKDDRFVA